MRFKNKETGVVLEPTNKFVIEQLKAQPEKYEVMKEKKITNPATPANDNK